MITLDISDKTWNTKVETSKKILAHSLCKFSLINDIQHNNTFESLSLVLESGSKLFSLDPIIDKKLTSAGAWYLRNDKKPYFREIDQQKKAFGKNYFRLNLTLKRNSFQKTVNFTLTTAFKKS